VSVGGPLSRMLPSPGERFGALVVAAADEISAQLNS